LLLLMALLLSGCGSASPVEVVQAYMEALSAFDAEGMAAQACPELAQAILDERAQVDIAKDSGMVIRVDGLQYETVAEEEETAVVRLVGAVAWAGVDEEVDEDLTLVKVEGKWKLCEDFR
jgi:hypothetical protein